MLFLIDGYNVTRSDPATAPLPLEQQREALVARLRTRGADLLGRGRIMVVFDGAGGAGATSAGRSPVEVRFSREVQADDLIVSLAAGSSDVVCVVSSDTGLAARIRGAARHGSEVRGSETLYEAAGRGNRRSKRRTRADVASLGVPPGGRRITRELEKLWLDGEDEG